ncbi:hypothetical protein BKA62DRAFT_142554, partial [Auriculariales sp. MPI-PUGE-AT-0066]
TRSTATALSLVTVARIYLSSEPALTAHKITAHDFPSPHRCDRPHCQRYMPNHQALQRHISTCATIPDYVFSCPLQHMNGACTRNLDRAAYLRHLQQHWWVQGPIRYLLPPPRGQLQPQAFPIRPQEVLQGFDWQRRVITELPPPYPLVRNVPGVPSPPTLCYYMTYPAILMGHMPGYCIELHSMLQ